jgi:hypothetical protein
VWPGYRPARGNLKTPESTEIGREAFSAMTPSARADRRAMREAQAEAMLDTIAQLAADAEHEMTRLNAARGFRHEVLGLPIQRSVSVDLTNLGDLSDVELERIAGSGGADAPRTEGDPA